MCLFSTLAAVTFEMRLEAFSNLTKFAIERNVTDVIALYMMKAQLFAEWVTGITPLDANVEPRIATKYQMRCAMGLGVLLEYTQRICKALKAL